MSFLRSFQFKLFLLAILGLAAAYILAPNLLRANLPILRQGIRSKTARVHTVSTPYSTAASTMSTKKTPVYFLSHGGVCLPSLLFPWVYFFS